MVREAIELTFGTITADALGRMLDHELGDRRALDAFTKRGAARSQAFGPRLIAHFFAGNVPHPGIVSICCGLLLKSANLVKMSSRDAVFPQLFVESLRDTDAELADCVATMVWSRDDTEFTKTLMTEADAVIAYGDDQSIAALRQITPTRAKFLAYGHKFSLGLICRESMTPERLSALAESAAIDASVYDQQGCLSPQAFCVEQGGALPARRFAEALAREMAIYQSRVPRGMLTTAEAASFATVRSEYEFRAASDNRVAVWASQDRNDWMVIYEDDPIFKPSCLNRVVYVKPIENLPAMVQLAQPFAGKISTVGVSHLNERVDSLASELARLGVHRICPIGQMQRPPLTWHHDGRPNLADLVTWVDLG